VQPLDVGIMGPFKSKLRNLWLEDTHVYVTAAEKRMAVILRAIKAWESISISAVQSAFEKAMPKPVLRD
jgi:hypothetical protein